MTKLTSMPAPNLSDLEKALELIKKELPVYLEFQEFQAIVLKTKYDACIGQGFTPEQALELCKTL